MRMMEREKPRRCAARGPSERALPPPQQQGRENGDAEQVGVYEHVPQQLVRLQAAHLPRERPLGPPLQHVGEHLLEGGQLGLRAAENAPHQEEGRPQQHERPPDLAPVHTPSSLGRTHDTAVSPASMQTPA